MEDNHDLFLQHLQDSEHARWQVAKWLTGRGYTVAINPLSFAITRDEWKEHTDNGDLHVYMRVEVKQLSCEFTSRKDWPYGKNFIVCARDSYDRAKPKPFAYLILNRSGTHAAFVLSSSFSTWKVEPRKDSRYHNVEQDFYLAPLESVSFSPLEDRP